MNKVYKTVWNNVRRMYVVVNEKCVRKSVGKTLTIAALGLVSFQAAAAANFPTDCGKNWSFMMDGRCVFDERLFDFPSEVNFEAGSKSEIYVETDVPIFTGDKTTVNIGKDASLRFTRYDNDNQSNHQLVGSTVLTTEPFNATNNLTFNVDGGRLLFETNDAQRKQSVYKLTTVEKQTGKNISNGTEYAFYDKDGNEIGKCSYNATAGSCVLITDKEPYKIKQTEAPKGHNIINGEILWSDAKAYGFKIVSSPSSLLPGTEGSDTAVPPTDPDLMTRNVYGYVGENVFYALAGGSGHLNIAVNNGGLLKFGGDQHYAWTKAGAYVFANQLVWGEAVATIDIIDSQLEFLAGSANYLTMGGKLTINLSGKSNATIIAEGSDGEFVNAVTFLATATDSNQLHLNIGEQSALSFISKRNAIASFGTYFLQDLDDNDVNIKVLGQLNLLGTYNPDGTHDNLWDLPQSGSVDNETYNYHYYAIAAYSGGIDNYGKVVINDYGLGALSSLLLTETSLKTPDFSNHSTGTVEATARAIFKDNSETGNSSKKNIIVLGKTDSKTSIHTLQDYVTSETVPSSWVMRGDWAKYSTWEDGGNLVITDIAYGTEAAAQIKKAFQDQFGTGTNISFTGTGSSNGSSTDLPVFKLSHVQELKDQGSISAGSIITSETLSAEAKDFSVADSGSWTEDIGFKAITDATSVSVSDGHTLTLMGADNITTATVAGVDAASTSNTQLNAARQHTGKLASASKAYASSTTLTTVLSDAPVSLANGNLVFGDARLTGTEGRIAEVTADTSSSIRAANGVFAIDALHGSGKVITDKTGTLLIGKAALSSIENAGTVSISTDFTFKDGQKLVNEETGTAFFNDAVIDDGGKITNKSGGTIHAGLLTVNGLGTISNSGDIVVDSLILQGVLRNNGSITVNGATQVYGAATLAGTGDFGLLRIGASSSDATADRIPVVDVSSKNYSKELDLAAGFVTVKDGGILAGEAFTDNRVGAQLSVQTGGVFGFSYDQKSLEAVLKDAEKISKDRAVAVLNTNITFDGGSIALGEGAGGATVNLGSNSLLIIGNSGNGVANLDLNGQTLSVADGALAAIGSDALWGNHYVLSGYDANGAKEAAKLSFVDAEGNSLQSGENDRGLFVTVGSLNILDKDKGYRLIGNMNWLLDGRQDVNAKDADQRFLAQALAAGSQGVKATQDTAGFTAQTGIVSEALRLAAASHDAVVSHALTGEGSKGSLWASGLASWGKTKTAGDHSAYKVNSTGFAMGADVKLDGSVLLGGSFSAQRSDLDGRDGNRSTNTLDAYGFSAYGAKFFDSGLTLAAAASVNVASSDASQTNALSRWEDTPDSRTFIIGMRGAYGVSFGNLSFMPYAGIDVKHVSTETVQLGEAFTQKSESVTAASVPLGLRAGWATPVRNGTLNLFGDLRATPSFGDTEADVTTWGRSTGISDAVSYDTTDKFRGDLTLGVGYRAQTGAIDFSWGMSKGTLRDFSQEVNLTGTLYF